MIDTRRNAERAAPSDLKSRTALTSSAARATIFTYASSYMVHGAMIEFHLDSRSGVPTYLQLVQQVKQAVRLGILQPGDQLPTVKEVVAKLVINPNTVLKAYRELDIEGIVEGRRGQGTFISETQPSPPIANHETVQKALVKWVASARKAGLDEEAIAALFATVVRASFFEEAA
jgi:GntR family transcriptional regulator